MRSLIVACEQLEVALRLFFEGKEYFAVITLAGAADELLGAFFKAKGGTTSLEELVKGSVRISSALSGARRSEGHLKDRSPTAHREAETAKAHRG